MVLSTLESSSRLSKKAIDIRQQSWFLATVITVHDRNNGRAYATVLCPSVVCLSSVMYCG